MIALFRLWVMGSLQLDTICVTSCKGYMSSLERWMRPMVFIVAGSPL